MKLKDIIPAKLGFGTAPLGNMFRAVPDDEAHATVEAAWNAGIRYYDTAPLYGAGLAELRLGEVISAKPRNEYVLSTKVGRVILDEQETSPRDLGEKGGCSGTDARTRSSTSGRRRPPNARSRAASSG